MLRLHSCNGMHMIVSDRRLPLPTRRSISDGPFRAQHREDVLHAGRFTHFRLACLTKFDSGRGPPKPGANTSLQPIESGAPTTFCPLPRSVGAASVRCVLLTLPTLCFIILDLQPSFSPPSFLLSSSPSFEHRRLCLLCRKVLLLPPAQSRTTALSRNGKADVTPTPCSNACSSRLTQRSVLITKHSSSLPSWPTKLITILLRIATTSAAHTVATF